MCVVRLLPCVLHNQIPPLPPTPLTTPPLPHFLTQTTMPYPVLSVMALVIADQSAIATFVFFSLNSRPDKTLLPLLPIPLNTPYPIQNFQLIVLIQHLTCIINPQPTAPVQTQDHTNDHLPHIPLITTILRILILKPVTIHPVHNHQVFLLQ